jgi:4-amino-4-deoxy-L-arabinose transferase-like glycosyltransferase
VCGAAPVSCFPLISASTPPGHLISNFSGPVGVGITVLIVLVLAVRMLWHPNNPRRLEHFRLVSGLAVSALIVLLTAIVVLRFAVLAS